jgi:hypothetical protein
VSSSYFNFLKPGVHAIIFINSVLLYLYCKNQAVHDVKEVIHINTCKYTLRANCTVSNVKKVSTYNNHCALKG